VRYRSKGWALIQVDTRVDVTVAGNDTMSMHHPWGQTQTLCENSKACDLMIN
jgi:hypothetical protein